jgi:hypothetical protein
MRTFGVFGLGLVLLAGGCDRSSRSCTGICGGAVSGSVGSGTDGDADGGAGSRTAGDDDASAGTSSGETPTSGDDGVKYDLGSSDVGSAEPSDPLVYANTETTLYRLDTESLEVEEIGDFDGCAIDGLPDMVGDIALDANDQMYAAGFDELYTVDVQTAKCTLVVNQDFNETLAFAPVGTAHDTREVLVGYHVIDYWTYDLVDQTKQVRQTLPNPAYGDIISVLDGPTLVTVGPPTEADGEGPDRLFLVDPVDGALLEDLGVFTADEHVKGLAFWGGTVYGFTDTGEILAIELHDDSFEVTLSESTGLSFRGAASSTVAPLVPQG